MTLTPAYGRDYKGKAAALTDLNLGKDFVANSYASSGYINNEGLAQHGITSVTIRYKRNTMVCVATFKNGVWK